MAPEVFRHEEYNEKVDVYSFALIVYWMLTGCRPFQDIVNPVEAAKAAALKDRKPNEKLIKPANLRKLLQGAWSPNSEDRPDFEEIVETIKRYNKTQHQENCVLQ